MESNDTDTPDLAEFDVFDYRDVVIVVSYTVMSSGQLYSAVMYYLNENFFSWYNPKYIGPGGRAKTVIAQGTLFI